MGLSIGQRQRGTPGAAEQQPALDAEVPAQRLDVGHQVLGGVLLEPAERPRSAGAALVEYDHSPEFRVEEPAMHRTGAGTRPAMEKQRRPATRIANCSQYMTWLAVSGR